MCTVGLKPLASLMTLDNAITRCVYLYSSTCIITSLENLLQRNAGLDETQAGIKIDGRNINNLRYAGDTTLMAEREEELQSLLMKVNRIVKSLA